MKYGDFWWISLEKGPITLAPTWFFMSWLFRIALGDMLFFFKNSVIKCDQKDVNWIKQLLY